MAVRIHRVVAERSGQRLAALLDHWRSRRGQERLCRPTDSHPPPMWSSPRNSSNGTSPTTATPDVSFASLAFQLATRLPDYRKLLLTLPEITELDRKEPAELFDYLLANPLRSVIGGGRERKLVRQLMRWTRQVRPDVMRSWNYSHATPRVCPTGSASPLPVRPESAVKTPLQGLKPLILDTHTAANRADLCDYPPPAARAAVPGPLRRRPPRRANPGKERRRVPVRRTLLRGCPTAPSLARPSGRIPARPRRYLRPMVSNGSSPTRTNSAETCAPHCAPSSLPASPYPWKSSNAFSIGKTNSSGSSPVPSARSFRSRKRRTGKSSNLTTNLSRTGWLTKRSLARTSLARKKVTGASLPRDGGCMNRTIDALTATSCCTSANTCCVQVGNPM